MRSFLPFLKIKIECPVLRKNVPVSCVYLWVIFLIHYAVLSVHKNVHCWAFHSCVANKIFIEVFLF